MLLLLLPKKYFSSFAWSSICSKTTVESFLGPMWWGTFMQMRAYTHTCLHQPCTDGSLIAASDTRNHRINLTTVQSGYTHVHTHKRTMSHTHTHRHKKTYTHTRTPTQTHTNTHTHTHTHTHSYIQTHKYMYINLQDHTHADGQQEGVRGRVWAPEWPKTCIS